MTLVRELRAGAGYVEGLCVREALDLYDSVQRVLFDEAIRQIVAVETGMLRAQVSAAGKEPPPLPKFREGGKEELPEWVKKFEEANRPKKANETSPG